MLKPQRQSDFTLPDFPPVFGAPWYWHRSSGAMESTRCLAQVLMEMRDEISHLEGDTRSQSDGFGRTENFGDPPRETSPIEAGLENPYGSLRRNASLPALDTQYKENTVMTVRRYSFSSNMPGGIGGEASSSGWVRVQDEVLHHGGPVRPETEMHSKKQTLQDLVHKNRAKVKTVTFLLPVDDIYTNRPVLSKQQEDSRTTELDSITDTDY